MNESVLQEAGLTNAEARIYTILVKSSPCPPPKIAELANESRTNTYKLLDSLEEKGLVSRDETQKKLRYWANNPSNLLENLKKKRTEMEATEKRYQDSLPTMIDEYFKHSEQPSIRYFYGKENLVKVYEDQLIENQPVTFVQSLGVRDFFGLEKMHSIRNEFPRRGIQRKVFYPDVPNSLPPGTETVPIAESDKAMLLDRTWLQDGDLTAPVEWSVYGDKVSIISLGTEAVGTIIESPQIAVSFRELLGLLEHKIKSQSDYEWLPKNHLYTKKPDVMK